jgi:hypothetical protein
MGKRAFLGLLLVVSVLLACAGSSHEAVGPDTYAIDCKRSPSNCYEEAGQACPDGFDVLDSQGQHGAVAIANTYGSTTNATVVPTYKGSMLVRCKH